MPNVQGEVTGKFSNDNGSTTLYVDKVRYSAFKDFQVKGVEKGSIVSFSFTEKPNANKPEDPYRNINGVVAVVGGEAAASAPAAGGTVTALQPRSRNGQQVGACLNLAVEAMGLEDMEKVERAAEELLLMGDRLAHYRVNYSKEFTDETKEMLEGIKEAS